MNTLLFSERHIGIGPEAEQKMIAKIGLNSLEELIDKTLPGDIRLPQEPEQTEPMSEARFAEHIANLAAQNQLFRSYIGQGWYGSITPAVILRNVFENPGWYTSYTPYQAEISQGRLEVLLHFQTMVCELCGLPLSNSSLLDEATSAAEAAHMMFNLRSREQEKSGANKLFVDRGLFTQSLAVLRTRCSEQGIELVLGDYAAFRPDNSYFGALLQYPNAEGKVEDYGSFAERIHKAGLKLAVAADLMALVMLEAPGKWGADIVFGSSQRFGIPMGYGGPAAAFFATREEFKRQMPGRIVGQSKDSQGKTAYRLALQTREQHIKRDKATSNICTATALMAIMSGFYAIYHGPKGLHDISTRIHGMTSYLNDALEVYGYEQENSSFFDTLKIKLPAGLNAKTLRRVAEAAGINLCYYPQIDIVGLSLDETVDNQALNDLIEVFASAAGNLPVPVEEEDWNSICSLDESLLRKEPILQQPVFNSYRSETAMMRYIKQLERKDISLVHSMISLGSCTMKLNAASEMLPLSRPEFGQIHPLAPKEQAAGYLSIIKQLEQQLCAITGFAACSLQPNSGAAGEYTGLRVIREYFKASHQSDRDLILIPDSAHGTNPASAAQAGFSIVQVKCDDRGNVDLDDWENKARENAARLAGCMITYPSTHGIFEPGIRKMCQVIHQYGGQVYMDGANMNAQVGLTSPGFIGADICHLNLHKTFAMPHGGGGPGAGPVCCAAHLAEYLPLAPRDKKEGITVASAPYGNAMLLPITYAYLCLLGTAGLKRATQVAILNANYLAACLKSNFSVLYTGSEGYVAHELILDCRTFKEAGISETDIAKRLMDYGFHAPTLSFPVHGTLMIEPTESESLEELDRFVQAMESIYAEIEEIRNGSHPADNNLLVNAPHAEYLLMADEWPYAYPRSRAAYPLSWIEGNKFQIPVSRVDNAYGDRNLICCSC
ncbi:MAG: aminomethyl-transferring glycine dehydrogenase [Bacteroidales bacterium]|nr:aminomethyl-transferring glycine dehydrogenase [Bacteroidales bacterium]MDD4361979.1 aminomethyl-transferring glycine dehydrogenase [Bacteroidales bacterium]MDD4430675.1 aminomethyl-transferring glycine dehydrogenase [Bacteroidales bacterium]